MSTKFIAGLILGAAAGAAIALFVTSDKGQEIVGNVKDAVGDAADAAKEKLSDLQDELGGLLKKGKAFVKDVEKQVKEATS